MTLNDLRKEVAALGFERDLAADYAFLSATRRALATIYNEKAVHGEFRLFRRPSYPTTHIEKIEHTANEDIVLKCNGTAYSFSVSGKGSFSVTDSELRIEKTFNSGCAVFRDFLYEETVIKFGSDLDYVIYDFCIYDTVFDYSSIYAIPVYRREAEYLVEKQIPDFLGFSSLPTDKNGKVIEGARLCNGIMYLPYDYSGEVNLVYRKMPPRPTLESPDEEMDMPLELEHLLPLLTASYIWLDDDAEKADLYLSLYREGMATVKLYGAKCNDSKYCDVLGWT